MFGSEVMFEPKIVYPLAYLSQIYGILGLDWLACLWLRMVAG